MPPQNPVQRAIVDVSALGVKLAYPDASPLVRSARERQIESQTAGAARSIRDLCAGVVRVEPKKPSASSPIAWRSVGTLRKAGRRRTLKRASCDRSKMRSCNF